MKSYFEINKMEHKTRPIQKTAFLACCDEEIQKYLTVKFTAMPDVDIISDDNDSYMAAVLDFFEQKNPLAMRGYDFFKESQKPSEDASSWMARVEGMAISAKVELMTYEDHIKFRIITGLVNDDALRTKLLKNYTTWSLQRVKEEISSHDATNRVSEAIDKKLMISNQANHVSSYRRDRTSTQQLQYQQPRTVPPNFFGGQRRPYSPNPRLPNMMQQRPKEGISFRQVGNNPRMGNAQGCWKWLPDGRRCGFTPFYQCKRHRQRNPNQVNQVAGENVGIGYVEDDLPQDVDRDPNMGFTNAVFYVSHRQKLKFDTIGGENWYDTDENGQPIMVDSVATPMVYVYIRYKPNGTQQRFAELEHKTFRALAMPDSGCTQNICSPRFARMCNLVVEERDTTQMYTANGQPLECKGSTKALLSYFGLVTPIKIYIIAGISNEYLMLSRKTCQRIQILPREYPLPIQECDFSTIEYPPKNDDPFYNTGKRFYKQDANQQVMTVEEKPQLKNPIKPEDAQINVLASFNNASEKPIALNELNKILIRYPRVFNITVKKTIKVPKVKFRFRKDIKVTPFKCTSSKPIPYALREAAKKEINEQIKLGIIARVPPHADIEWCSRGMILEKPNGGRD
ncbi:MAG: retropepsin-like aspartic protease, partial [Candidatus Poribacteria bacterium]|nr:retropepsin-like aspartic protease [Candidatus Poribacteria bacterium]